MCWRGPKLPPLEPAVVAGTDAAELLGRMAGEAAPADWQGGLELVYRLGGALVPGLEGGLVTVEVRTEGERLFRLAR